MNTVSFIQNHNNFPLNSKLWVYQGNRILQNDEVDNLQKDIDAFTAQWQAHGASLKASGMVISNLFIVLIVDESYEAASGCSIDSSVHFIKKISDKYQLDFFDRNQIAYLDASKAIKLIDKKHSNQIENSLVFNTSVNSFASFQKEFILPFKDSAFAKLDTKNSFSLRL